MASRSRGLFAKTIPVSGRTSRDNSRGDNEMSVDGDWNITMSTPLGERETRLSVKSSGATLSGTQSAEGDTAEIFDGAVNGNDVAWKVSITNPMPLTLEFAGKVDGNAITGEMTINPMGSFPFSGTKA
jgi:hypothetical protein